MKEQLVVVLIINTINDNNDPAWMVVDKLMPTIQTLCNKYVIPNAILIMDEDEQLTGQVIGDKLSETIDTVRSVSAVADVPNVINDLVGNCFGDILILGEACARELHERIEIEGVRPVTPLLVPHTLEPNNQIYGFTQGFSRQQINDMPYRIISSAAISIDGIPKYVRLAIASGYIPCGPLQYASTPAPVFGNYWQTLYAPGNELEQNALMRSQLT